VDAIEIDVKDVPGLKGRFYLTKSLNRMEWNGSRGFKMLP